MSSFNRSAIDWVSVIALSLLLLIAGQIGERLSFGNRIQTLNNVRFFVNDDTYSCLFSHSEISLSGFS